MTTHQSSGLTTDARPQNAVGASIIFDGTQWRVTVAGPWGSTSTVHPTRATAVATCQRQLTDATWDVQALKGAR